MIFLFHNKSFSITKILKEGTEIKIKSSSCTAALWEMAEKFPNAIISWCSEDLEKDLNLKDWDEIFNNDLVMASYAVRTAFFSHNIGYVDQSPFINVNRKVRYGTWLMSSDVGGIKGKVLLKFKHILKGEKNFNFLINSIAKIGQQNGLFCYSHPHLVLSSPEPLKYLASSGDLFRFINLHYKVVWTTVLLFCFCKYESKIPVISFLRSWGSKNWFGEKIDLSNLKISEEVDKNISLSIDVIIPTMGRSRLLNQVLNDLKAQTLLPQKVIVVEQNSTPGSKTAIPEIDRENWPFEIKHSFIHQAGACNARNLALKEVTSDWIFFADDDIRITPDLLQKASKAINQLGLTALNMNCKQAGEKTVFPNIKQWASFGSGTSIVQTFFAKKCSFNLAYEHGYGEDADYGRQLRNVGCDIVYHPEVEILHLKAPNGGFRVKLQEEHKRPKPSPTLMLYALKYYTLQQMRGFKISMYLKYYNKQPTKNPFIYIKKMNRRWKKSYVRGKNLYTKFEDI